MMKPNAGALRDQVADDRERAYDDWQRWAEETAYRLERLPADERIRALRAHQSDLPEALWYRVAQSLVATPADPIAGQSRPHEDANVPGSVEPAIAADRPVPRTPPQPADRPVTRKSDADGLTRPRPASGHLYDVLVGLLTIGGIVGGLVWLLTVQVN